MIQFVIKVRSWLYITFPFLVHVLLRMVNRSRRVYFRLNEGNASESLLDLDNLSGFTELKFESTNEAGIGCIVKVGVSLKALDSEDFLPAQLVTISPRYVISNESMAPIFFRQLDLEVSSFLFHFSPLYFSALFPQNSLAFTLLYSLACILSFRTYALSHSALLHLHP